MGEGGERVEHEQEAYFSIAAQTDGRTLCLTLAGELDWAVTGHVEGTLEQVRGPDVEHVVFDLSALTFIDLSGLKTILATHDRGTREGFDVTVIRPRGLANRIFTLTRAGEALIIVDGR